MSAKRALVAGAGGFLGRSIVRAFHGNGWEVRALVHRPERIPLVEEVGGVATLGSLLDVPRLREACRGCEVLVHVASSDPSGPEGPEGARRTRVEGARALRAAAEAEGVRRLVIGSGYWVYADNPGTITETSPLDPRGESAVNRETELAALEGAGPGTPEVLVVRPGMVYGAGSWLAGIVEALREGTYRYIDQGRNPWSFVSLPDAGEGFARVAERGRAGEIYNLVDGVPMAWRDFGDRLSERMGLSPPGSLDRSQAEALYGPEVAHHLSARRACSAAKIRSLGWAPVHADVVHGLAQLGDWLRSGDPERGSR